MVNHLQQKYFKTKPKSSQEDSILVMQCMLKYEYLKNYWSCCLGKITEQNGHVTHEVYVKYVQRHLKKYANQPRLRFTQTKENFQLTRQIFLESFRSPATSTATFVKERFWKIAWNSSSLSLASFIFEQLRGGNSRNRVKWTSSVVTNIEKNIIQVGALSVRP